MKIKAIENGPLIVEVNNAKLLKDGKKEELNKNVLYLCRCGESGNKPFCDGAHKKCDFKGAVVELEIS